MMLRSEASLWHEINGDKETTCWKTFDTALIRAFCYARATSNESHVKSARTAIMHAYTQSATSLANFQSEKVNLKDFQEIIECKFGNRAL